MPKSRNVKDDVDDFCGWPFLLELIETASTPFMQGLIAALFGTGGRISEVLALQKRNVDTTLHPEVVVVQQMPLLKRFEKDKQKSVIKWKCDGHCNKRWNKMPTPTEFREHKIKAYDGWITKPILDHRTFPILQVELTTPYFTSWCETVKKGLLFPIKRSAAFVKVRAVGRKLDADIPFCNIRSPKLYCHWFRAERAYQLAFDYGFDRTDLEVFFDWKERKPSMAAHYASAGWISLAKKMGAKV